MASDAQMVTVGVSEALSIFGVVVATTAGAVLWIVNRFQTKSNANTMKKEVVAQVKQVESDAKDNLESFKDQVEKRFNRNESDIKDMTQVMHKIDKSLEYIKGRVEPK